MILGILSDTHGQSARAGRAISLLKRLGAEAFVHCGDVGSEAVFEQLAGLRAWFVWGNTDDRSAYSAAYLRAIGLTPPDDPPTVVELAGKVIHVYHGHETPFGRLSEFAMDGDVSGFETTAGTADYICYGHSHIAADSRTGRVRLINPGALHRASVYTVATLDIALDTVEHWRVNDSADDQARPQRVRVSG
jgi:putative phosphoesterase